EALAVGIVADELVADAIQAIDRAHQLSCWAQSIEIRNHRNFVWDRKIGPFEAERPQPQHRIGQLFRWHFAGEIPPVKPRGYERFLHHVLGWIARDGLAEATDDFLERTRRHDS